MSKLQTIIKDLQDKKQYNLAEEIKRVQAISINSQYDDEEEDDDSYDKDFLHKGGGVSEALKQIDNIIKLLNDAKRFFKEEKGKDARANFNTAYRIMGVMREQRGIY